jgi:hypothetical protein
VITLAEVIEACAQECESFPDAAAIRALAAQYEGCIVAEGKPVLFAVPWQSQDQSSLYRAKQPETCKPALQVERTDPRRPLTDEAIWRQYQALWPFHPADEPRLAKDIVKFARAIERAHKIGGNDE